MNIDDSVNQIVQNIVNQITAQVQQQAMQAIEQKINEVVASLDATAILSERINHKLDVKLSTLPIDSKSIEATLSSRVNDLANNLSTTVQNRAIDAINNLISQQVNRIDFPQICQASLLSALKNRQFEFLEDSIPPEALQKQNLLLSGSNIQGGIITQFGSTGIDDKATTCQVTVFDEMTVVENNLLTKDLTVKGTTTIEGDLNVTGTMPESSPLFQNIVRNATNNVRSGLDESVFKGYSDIIFKQIKEDGIDLNKLSLNGRDIVNGNSLSHDITDSALQKVGQLKELQVTGETLLTNTLYTGNKRIGINTVEPAQVLSVWDQEIEIGVGKQSNNTGVIGTPRNHSLAISTNGKNNIVLTPDGATTVNQLNIGTTNISVSGSPPTNDQPKGSIVFNTNPSVGGPMGWVSLGNASWANFGIID